MISNKGYTMGNLWNMTDRSPVISFIGAGGKTTCLTRLHQELVIVGQNNILTTTTKVYPFSSISSWQNPQAPPEVEKFSSCFWLANIEPATGKWQGPALQAVDMAVRRDWEQCGEQGRIWLIEADGAREKMLKFWAAHEPQIPTTSRCAVLIFNAALWKQVLQPNQVHRPELKPELIGRVFNCETFWSYLSTSPLADPRYKHMSWIVLCNSSAPSSSEASKGASITFLDDMLAWWRDSQHQWVNSNFLPNRLRLAQGNAREGDLHWYDL